MRGIRLFFLCFFIGHAPWVAADDFTNRFVSALKRAHPNANVETVDSDALRVSFDGKNQRTLYLDNIRRACAADPDSCGAAIERHVKIVASVDESDGLDAHVSRLRVIHRHRDYIAHTERLFREAAEKDQREGKPARGPIEDTLLVSRPWLGDVVQTVVLDYPDRTTPLNRARLRELGRSVDEVFTLALRQTGQELEPIDPMPLSGAAGIFLIGGSYYASSYFQTDAWEKFSKRTGTDFALGCVGAAELAAVALQPDAGATETLQRLCRAVNAREPRPVS